MRSFRDETDEWLVDTVGKESNKLVTLLDKLTDQQYLFCKEYVKSGSALEAAKKAKIPKSNNPHMLVHLPKIAACINILRARREADLGEKSSAEIVERLKNTPMVGAEDFDFSEEIVQEREEQLADNGEKLKSASDDRLTENVQHADVSNGIMQLPKVRVPPAQSFGPQWVIERFVTVAERCLQIEPVYDRKGRPIGQFKFEANAALKALENLGKTMAMFKDRIEVAHTEGTFSDEELDSRLRALTQRYPEFKDVIEGEVSQVTKEAINVGE